MNSIAVNGPYELYQIITDFHDSLEIFREAIQNAYDEDATEIICSVREVQKLNKREVVIEVLNNGHGLPSNKVSHFFDLANSTKVDTTFQPVPGKVGYKGHGSKIFFNADRIEIISKTSEDLWTSSLIGPLDQLESNGTISYESPSKPTDGDLELPPEWSEGFGVRIVGHRHFNSEYTKHKLNHENLRDYIKWFTVMGSVTIPNIGKNRPKLYLRGIELSAFKVRCEGKPGAIDPSPVFDSRNSQDYEVLEFGHYFPPERKTQKTMETYSNLLKSSKPYYEYYSHRLADETVVCTSGLKFRLVLNLEGYETKRRYDTLLPGRGKSRTNISHADTDRYGIWACKGGVPVEKVDHWVESGKGGYTFVHGFVDCDEFSLTANRGSINNTPAEKIDLIKGELTRLFNTPKFQNAIAERSDFERLESQLRSIDEDGKNLIKRHDLAIRRRKIHLPNGIILDEPSKRNSGYSESETMVMLVQLVTYFPDFFTYKLLDYDTTKGIDFVVYHKGSPKYIELRGTLKKSMNHPFRHVFKFICYELGIQVGDSVVDIEPVDAVLKKYPNSSFESNDARYKGARYLGYKLETNSASVASMEVVELKSLLIDVLGAKIQ